MATDCKTVLITGITGQDGAHLARLLLGKGYVVHGMRPYAATDDLERLRDFLAHPRFHLHHGDLDDGSSLIRLVQRTAPDEIYNLGALSHVAVSFDQPERAIQTNGVGTLRLLEAIRILNLKGKTRLYQASSSEMFGNAAAPQSETTPFAPCSPYACAKLYAHEIVRTYRQSYGIHACNGILFNHESPLRGEEFVTRKIAMAVAALADGRRQAPLTLGNLESRRDWGHAADYVRGMWLMLQHPVPDDYVLATGQAHSVRDFVVAAFRHAGLTLGWRGQGVNERAYCASTGALLVVIDPALYRPAEVHHLLGDAGKARRILGWAPEVSFDALVADMVDAELGPLRAEHDYAIAAE